MFFAAAVQYRGLRFVGCDPGTGLRRLIVRKHANPARHQESKSVDRVVDPFDIRDNRRPLPSGEVLNSDFEIFPRGARIDSRKLRAQFIVQRNLSCSFSAASIFGITTCS